MNPIQKSWFSGAFLAIPVGAAIAGSIPILWLAAIGIGGAIAVNKLL